MRAFIQKHTSKQGRLESAKTITGIAIFFSLVTLWGLTESANTLTEVVMAFLIGVSMTVFFTVIYNQLVEIELSPKQHQTRMANIVITQAPLEDDGLVVGFKQTAQ